MAIDDNLSFGEMHGFQVSEISDLILRAYSNAKKEIRPLGNSIKSKWDYAMANAERQSFLIYIEKYINGDESVERNIKNYTADYLLAESQGDFISELEKLWQKKNKYNYLSYGAAALGTLTLLGGPIFVIPSVALLSIYFKKSCDIKGLAQKAELNYIFKESQHENLKELPKEYLKEAIESCKEKLQAK